MSSNSIRILLIDDQKDFIDTISFWLRTKGHEVKTAMSGMEGVEEIKKGGIDLVFLDFKMPDMNGLQTLEKIREFNKTIPVVIVTAYADDAIVSETKRYNISGLDRCCILSINILKSTLYYRHTILLFLLLIYFL